MGPVQTNNGNRCAENERLSIGFFTYLDVATDLDSWQLRGHVESKPKSTCEKLAKARIPIYAFPCRYETENPLREADLEKARIKWQKDDTRARVLNSLVKAHLGFRPAKITKIVCLGLGPLQPVDVSERLRQRWDLNHHRLASDIASILLQEYYSNDIEIVLSDPGYMPQRHDWLKELKPRLKVRFAENLSAILEVDKNTLVLAHGSPGFPVRQIVVDVTKPFGGPAGFFCQTIPKFPTTGDEIAHCHQPELDPANRHVASMEKDYSMKAICTAKEWASTLYLKQA